MNQVELLAGESCTDHLTSSQFTKALTLISLDRIETELFAKCHQRGLPCLEAAADMQFDPPGSLASGQLVKLTYQCQHAYVLVPIDA